MNRICINLCLIIMLSGGINATSAPVSSGSAKPPTAQNDPTSKVFKDPETKLYGVKNGGDIIVKPIYESATRFRNGISRVKLNGKYGFIDNTGKVTVPIKYDSLHPIASDGLIVAKNDGKYGYIDTTGREVIPLKYDSADGFIDGKAKVTMDDKTYFIDTHGRKVDIDSGPNPGSQLFPYMN